MSGSIGAPAVSAVPYDLRSVPRFGSMMLTTVPVTPLVRLAIAAESILFVSSGVNAVAAAGGADGGAEPPGEHAASDAMQARATVMTAAPRGTALREVMVIEASCGSCRRRRRSIRGRRIVPPSMGAEGRKIGTRYGAGRPPLDRPAQREIRRTDYEDEQEPSCFAVFWRCRWSWAVGTRR